MFGQTYKVTIDGVELEGIKIALPKKTAVVRFPTAKEQNQYTEAAHNRKPSDDEPDLKAEADLFQAIRLDKGEAFDQYEAQFAIIHLLGVQVVSSQKVGDDHVFTIKTPFGEVVHTLRAPSFKQMALFERAIAKQPAGRFTLKPGIKLYDDLHEQHTGYTSSYSVEDIPGDHKSLCIAEIRLAHFMIDPIQAADPNS